MAEPSYPEELLYHDQHDWARLDGEDHAVFGITWYAQDSLGEVVFYDPPELGATIAKDSAYAEVESVKAVSDVIAPLSGEIVEVNDALAEAPEQINEDPYGEGWLVRVRLSHPAEADGLLGAARIPQAAGKRLGAPAAACVALPPGDALHLSDAGRSDRDARRDRSRGDHGAV